MSSSAHTPDRAERLAAEPASADPQRRGVKVKPTASPARLPGRRWRLGACTTVAVMAMTGAAIAPGAAHADPGTGTGPITLPRLKPVPCADLGPIRLVQVTEQLSEGYVFTVRSATSTFDVAYGRFVQNPTPVEIDGQWNATEARTVAITMFFSQSVTLTSTIVEGFGAAVTVTTGIQVVQSRTTKVGVGAVAKVPPNRTMLGEYGLQGLDVVFDMQRVSMLRDAPQTCYLWLDSTIANNTAHVPTINEGWRFTLV